MYLLFCYCGISLKRYTHIGHISTIFLLKHWRTEIQDQASEWHALFLLMIFSWWFSQVTGSRIWVVKRHLLGTQPAHAGTTHGVSTPKMKHTAFLPPSFWNLSRKQSSKLQVQTQNDSRLKLWLNLTPAAFEGNTSAYLHLPAMTNFSF